MKRVVVTGATSMIGVALIEECVKNNIEVLAIVRGQSTRMSRLPKSALITVMECPLDKLCLMEAENKKYDVFYHFAWDYTAKENRDNPVLQEKNIKYTLDAAELARRLGCKKFIGAGSQAEYGKVDGVIDKNTPLFPTMAYGIAKCAAGRLSKNLCEKYNMIHVWGRIFSVYGKYDNEGTMLNYAIDKFLNNEVAMFSAGTQKWDYLHETDAGKIFYYLGKEICESDTYVVASGKSKPLRCYIEEIRSAFNGETKCVYAKENGLNAISLEVITKDTEMAIGYTPQISFSDGIEQMIEYRRKLLSDK